MAAGIDLPRLFNNLITSLKLRPGPRDEPELSNVLVAVYEITQVLTTRIIVQANLNLQTAPTTALYTVPAGKRARLKASYHEATTAATQLVVRIGTSTTERVFLGALGTAAAAVICDVLMDAGDVVSYGETGNAGDTARQCNAALDLWDYVP